MAKPRTLDQILGELGGTYKPQIDNIRKRQSAIPGQIRQEEQGLQAKQENAFGDILSGARRRGTGVAFGGIPLGEQAKYTATEYLPALARLKQSGREQAMSLEDAILGINERRQNQALGIRQYEQQRFDQREQFERQLQAQREEAARSRAAASAASFSPSFGGGVPQGGGGGPQVNPLQQRVAANVFQFLQQGDDAVRSDYAATLKSAQRGNPMDKLKIQLYHQAVPHLFKRGTPSGGVTSNRLSY